MSCRHKTQAMYLIRYCGLDHGVGHRRLPLDHATALQLPRQGACEEQYKDTLFRFPPHRRLRLFYMGAFAQCRGNCQRHVPFLLHRRVACEVCAQSRPVYCLCLCTLSHPETPVQHQRDLRCATLRLAACRSGVLSHRTAGAAHAVGTAWPTAGGTGRCARGDGAKRPVECPIRQACYRSSITV